MSASIRPAAACPSQPADLSVYFLYWDKSTNTDNSTNKFVQQVKYLLLLLLVVLVLALLLLVLVDGFQNAVVYALSC